MSTLQRLLKNRPLKTGSVVIDGETYNVHELSARQRDAIAALFRGDNKDIMRINAVIACMGTEGLTEKDADGLVEGSAEMILALSQEVLKLSGMGDDAVDEAKPNS
jgi:hypothetical protein